jgi:hypothetical protein
MLNFKIMIQMSKDTLPEATEAALDSTRDLPQMVLSTISVEVDGDDTRPLSPLQTELASPEVLLASYSNQENKMLNNITDDSKAVNDNLSDIGLSQASHPFGAKLEVLADTSDSIPAAVNLPSDLREATYSTDHYLDTIGLKESTENRVLDLERVGDENDLIVEEPSIVNIIPLQSDEDIIQLPISLESQTDISHEAQVEVPISLRVEPLQERVCEVPTIVNSVAAVADDLRNLETVAKDFKNDRLAQGGHSINRAIQDLDVDVVPTAVQEQVKVSVQLGCLYFSAGH